MTKAFFTERIDVMNLRNRAVVAGLSAVLAFGTCVPLAYASPRSELAAASQQLESLGSELASMQEKLSKKTAELEDTSYRIGEKQAEIEKTEAELEEAKAVLGERMRSSYKSGPTSLLEVLLGSASLDDIISRIYYMDKIASSDAETINAVRTLEERLSAEKQDLEKTKDGQQKAVDELRGQIDEYGAKVAEAQSYYNSLDAQVQREIAEQQKAEENARVQAALAAAEQTPEPQATPQQATQEPAQQTEDTSKQQEQTPQEEPQVQEPETQQDATTSSGGGTSYAPSGGGLDSAYAAIGTPYVWGATGPDGFDCSGLVCYCYGYDRGRDTYSMISSLQSTGSWKTSMDELSEGDLVFTSEGHVGIYIGGGQMIHAPSPGYSVTTADVYAFIGGGTY